MKRAVPSQIFNALADTLHRMAAVGDHLRAHERVACWQAAEELARRGRNGEAIVPLPERTTPVTSDVPLDVFTIANGGACKHCGNRIPESDAGVVRLLQCADGRFVVRYHSKCFLELAQMSPTYLGDPPPMGATFGKYDDQKPESAGGPA